MNAKTRLSYWLGSKKKNYKQGVDIFKELSIDTSKNKFLDTDTPTNIHKDILFKGLTKYARIYKIRPIKSISGSEKKNNPTGPEENKGIIRPIIDTNPHIKYNELSEDLKKLYDEIREEQTLLKTKSAKIRAINENSGNDDQRKALAAEILEHQKSIREKYDRFDRNFNKNVPEAAKVDNRSEFEKIEAIKDPEQRALTRKKRIEANLNYLRRYKNSDKPKQLKTIEERKKELDAWKIDYSDIIAK